MNAQELIIGHVLPIAATIAVLWLVYRLLFRNSNRLKFNRYFLLTSMLLALLMPLLGLLSGLEVPQMATLKQNLFSGFLLNEVIVTSDGQPMLPEVTVTTSTQSHFSVWQVIAGIYLIGVAVMTLLFLIKLGRLMVLIIRSPKRKMSGGTAVYLSSVPEPVEGPQRGSFSFMRYAIFPNENVDPDIMRHEMSHIEHGHSWDILFVEVMMILQWFNPFIYLYKKELQSLHEYQADRDVVATGVDKKNYMMLILQQCTAVDFSGMSNNFSLILTKKRIKMITRNEKAKGLWWRLLATLPVLALLLIANTKVTAQEAKAEKEDVAPTTTIQADIDGDLTTYHITSMEELKVILDKVANDTIFNIVDEMPEFPGGVEAMMNYIAENVKYPEDAKDKNQSGRVMISFVVEKDGRVNDVKVLRGVCESIDNEAVRVVKAMPNWKPGKQAGKPVRVSYCLPISFKLSDGATEKTAKKSDVNPDKNDVYQTVEEMPQFPGGETAMMEFVAKNIVYPEEARDKEISGRVFVKFVVEKDGSISEVKVAQGIGGGCDEEAVRVVKAMPKWKPGKQDGQPVRVSFTMPFTFKLQ